MITSPFYILPYEVYLLIFNDLDRSSLSRLCLASRFLNELAMSALYSDMIWPIFFDHSYIRGYYEQFQKKKKSVFPAFQRWPALREYVRSVTLYSMDAHLAAKVKAVYILYTTYELSLLPSVVELKWIDRVTPSEMRVSDFNQYVPVMDRLLKLRHITFPVLASPFKLSDATITRLESVCFLREHNRYGRDLKTFAAKASWIGIPSKHLKEFSLSLVQMDPDYLKHFCRLIKLELNWGCSPADLWPYIRHLTQLVELRLLFTIHGLSRGPSIPSSLLRYPDLRRLYIGLDPLGYQPNTLTRLAEVYRSLASHSDLEEVHLNANVTGKRFYNETRTLFSTLMRLHGRLKVLRVDGMSPPQDIVRTFGTRLPGLWELGLTMTEDIILTLMMLRNCVHLNRLYFSATDLSTNGVAAFLLQEMPQLSMVEGKVRDPATNGRTYATKVWKSHWNFDPGSNSTYRKIVETTAAKYS